MKIPELRKKIIINFSATGVLLAIFGGIVFFYIHEKGAVEGRVNKIKTETSTIRMQTVELESKTNEAKKYKELWKKITPNKKNTGGIKMDDVNAKLTAIAEKYTILNPSIKVTLPETLKDGIFQRRTVTVLFTTVNLTFGAVNDVKALLFINEFIESLQGYPIITSLDIRKNKDYSIQELIDLSSGKSTGAISGKVDFFWYVYKDLENKEKKDDKTTILPPQQKPAGAGILKDLKDVKEVIDASQTP